MRLSLLLLLLVLTSGLACEKTIREAKAPAPHPAAQVAVRQ